jgi:hypothetical protein
MNTSAYRRLHSTVCPCAGNVDADTVLMRRTYALVIVEHGTRRARLAGITAFSDGARTTQPAARPHDHGALNATVPH